MDYAHIKKEWERITGAWAISISEVKNFKWQGFEMTRQQLTARYSWSKGWLPAGINDLWRAFKAEYKGIANTEPDRPLDFDKWAALVIAHQPTNPQKELGKFIS